MNNNKQHHLLINYPIAKWFVEKFYEKDCVDHSEGFAPNVYNAYPPNIIKNTFLNICFLISSQLNRDNTYCCISFDVTEEFLENVSLQANDAVTFRTSLHSIGLTNLSEVNISYIFFLNFIKGIYQSKTSNFPFLQEDYRIQDTVSSCIGKHHINKEILCTDAQYILNSIHSYGNIINVELEALDVIMDPMTFTRRFRFKPKITLEDNKLINYLKLYFNDDELIFTST